LVDIPGGTFSMGNPRRDGFPGDGEMVVHPVEVPSFRMAATAVTNAQFALFVAETGYLTDAEHYGWSFVFAGLLPDTFPPTQGVVQAPWWRKVDGANWRHPEGSHSDCAGREIHPAVHVSWNDARAFCTWADLRLPTEAEWEYAARGGLAEARFPWGDDLCPSGEHRMNVWQGVFPRINTRDDGYLGTAPVRSYPPNGYELFETTGNVWEWCEDWFAPDYYRVSPRVGPRGPRHGEFKVMRGGSYLCHASYCNRYRVDARSSNTPDASTGNIGFRCAATNALA